MKKSIYRKVKVSRQEDQILQRIKAHTGRSFSSILGELSRAGLNNKEALLRYYGRGLTDELINIYNKAEKHYK